MISVLTRDIREDRHKEESHIKTEAEIRVMQQQAKEHLEPLEHGRGKEKFFP